MSPLLDQISQKVRFGLLLKTTKLASWLWAGTEDEEDATFIQNYEKKNILKFSAFLGY